MSDKIEERVTKLVFDNSAFEKYARESLATLGRFEEQMDHFAKNNAVVDLGSKMITGFRDVTSTIDKVGKKYSWLEQIAVGAYRKIGESATNYLKNEVFKITGISEAISGWQKYESEIESVQSIMNATGLNINAVEKELKKLGWYTDETSFKYADMVSNIAKFNAAGISDLGEATDSMIGIGNMAGYFGVNATKATHAMEGFAKAMGVGYMGTDSWRWIETAGMNAMSIQKAFIDTAVEMKQIKKLGKDLFETKAGHQFTSSEFKTILKDKWLDKAVMTETFKKYSKSVNTIYDAWLAGGEVDQVSDLIDELGDSLDATSRDAFRASQQAKTFTDVIGSLEEVVASGWRTSFKYIFGNYEEARSMWTSVVNELWDIFAESGYKRNDLLKGWYEGGGRDAFLNGVANMWYGLMAVINPIKEAFDTIFPGTTIERLIELTKKFETFSEKFRKWFDFGFVKENDDQLTEVVKETETFEEACERTRKNLDKLYNEVNAGKWGHMWDRWKALGEAGYVWQIVQNEVNKRYTEAGVGNYSKRYDIVDDGTLKKREKEVEVLADEANATNKVTAAQLLAQRRSENLTKTMMGLFSAVDLVKDAFGEFVKFLGKTFGKVIEKLGPTFDSILKVTGKWGDELYRLRQKLDSSFLAKFFENASETVSDFVANAINNFVPNTIEAIKKVIGWIDKIADFLYPIVEIVGGAIYYTIKNLPGLISKAYKSAKPFFSNLKQNVGPYIKMATDWVQNTAYPFLKSMPQTIIPFFTDIYGRGKKFVTDIWNKLAGSEGLQKLKTSLKSAWEGIKTFGKQTWEYLKQLAQDTTSTFGQFFANYTTEDGGFDWAKLFADTLDFAMEKVSGFITALGDLVGKSKEFFNMFNKGGEAEGVKILAADIGTTTKDLDTFAEEKLEPAKKLLEDIWKWLKDVTAFLKDPITYASNALKSVVDTIINIFDGLNLEKLGSIFKDTGIGLFFGALAKNIATGAYSIANIPSAFAGTLWALKDVFTAYSKSINAKAILNIAKALGIMTLSIIALGSMPPDTLTDIVAMISAIGLVTSLLVAMLAMYQKYKKVQEVKDTVKSVYNIEMKGTDMVTALVSPLREFMATLGIGVNSMLKKIAGAVRIAALAAAVAIVMQKIMDVYEFITKVNAEGEDGKRKLYESIGFIVAIGAVFVILSGIMGKIQNNSSIGWALSFVTIAAGLAIVIEVVKRIAQWDVNTINNAWAAVTMATVALIGIAYALKLSQTKMMDVKNGTKSKTSNHMLAIALLLVAFAAAFTIMTPALLALGQLSLGQFAIAITSMIFFATVVMTMGWVAKEIGDSAKDIIKGVAAIGAVILMTTLMFTVFTAIGTLMKLNGVGTSLLYGLGALAASLSLVAIMALLMEQTHVNVALEKFAQATAKFGFGIIALSIAFALFAKAFPTIIDAVIYLGEKLNDPATREAFVHGLLAIGTAVLAALILMKTDVARGVVEIFKAIFGALSSNFGVMLGQLTGMITKVINWIMGNKFLLIGAVVILIALLFSFLDAIVPDLVDRLVKIILILINSLAKTLLTRTGQLMSALLNVFGVILVLLEKAIAWLFGKLGGIFFGEAAEKKVNEFFDKIIPSDELEKKIDNDIKELQGATDKYEESAVKTINTAKTNIKNRTDDGGLSLGNLFGDLSITPQVTKPSQANGTTGGINMNSMMKGVGFELPSMLTGGAPQIYESADEAFSNIPDALKENFGVAGMDAEDGMEKINQIISGTSFANSSQEAARSGIDGANQYIEDDTSFEEGIKTKVEGSIQGTMLHLKGWAKPFVSEAIDQGIVQPAISAMDGLPAEMERRGLFAVQGFVNGVTSRTATEKIWAAGSGVTKAFLSSYDITSGTESPAKTMIWRGLMAILGLSKGVYDNVSLVENAGAYVANSMIGAVNDVIDTGFDMSPTLTPVVDLSDVRNSSGMINSLFNNPHMLTGLSDATNSLSSALASDVFGGFNQNQILKQTQIENINTNNADVVRSLGELRGDINNLNDSFSNTAVVLDSGALVGATAKQMDNALGRFKVLKGRGI